MGPRRPSFAPAMTVVCLLAVLGAVTGAAPIDQQCAVHTGCGPGDEPGFPVTIDTPGKYLLTSSLRTRDVRVSVIEISTSHVTIDMNGYSIQGPTVCLRDGSGVTCEPEGSGHGIRATGSNITVRNGTIDGMGGFGILLNGGRGCRVEGVHVSSNAGKGIDLLGGGIVSDSTVVRNGMDGISAGVLETVAIVRSNAVQDNGMNGIAVSDGGTIVDDTVSDNAWNGIFCRRCTVARNSSWANDLDGIEAEGLVTDNYVGSNDGYGLRLEEETGYAGNVVRTHSDALGTVIGGIEIGSGTNLCDGEACP